MYDLWKSLFSIKISEAKAIIIKVYLLSYIICIIYYKKVDIIIYQEKHLFKYCR